MIPILMLMVMNGLLAAWAIYYWVIACSHRDPVAILWLTAIYVFVERMAKAGNRV